MQNQNIHAPIIGDFVAPEALWDESAPKRIFHSPSSWRWFLRKNRARLIERQAICRHTGRDLVHLGRVEKVAEEIALASIQRA